MGNCLPSQTASSQDVGFEHPPPGNVEAAQSEEVGRTKSSFRSVNTQLESTKRGARAKNVVSFPLQEKEETGGEGKAGSFREGRVRIRVVMSRRELKQLLELDAKPHLRSSEQVLSAVKRRGTRKISRDRDSEGAIGTPWKPALESIPENS